MATLTSDTDDPNDELLKILRQQQSLYSPEAERIQGVRLDKIAQQKDLLALAQGLNSASSKFGSVKGETPQPSSFGQTAEAFGQNLDARAKGIAAEPEQKANRLGMNAKVYEFLANKQLEERKVKAEEDKAKLPKPVSFQSTTLLDPQGNPIKFNSATGEYSPASAPKGVVMPTAVKNEGSLRGEYEGHPTTKKTDILESSYAGMLNTPPTPQGDVSLMYNFIRMQDPTSAVREGEIDLVRAARSVDQSILAAYEKARAGNLLTDQERAGYKQQAGKLVESQMSAQNQLDEHYSEISKSQNVDVSHVVRKRAGTHQSSSPDVTREQARQEIKRRQASKGSP